MFMASKGYIRMKSNDKEGIAMRTEENTGPATSTDSNKGDDFSASPAVKLGPEPGSESEEKQSETQVNDDAAAAFTEDGTMTAEALTPEAEVDDFIASTSLTAAEYDITGPKRRGSIRLVTGTFEYEAVATTEGDSFSSVLSVETVTVDVEPAEIAATSTEKDKGENGDDDISRSSTAGTEQNEYKDDQPKDAGAETYLIDTGGDDVNKGTIATSSNDNNTTSSLILLVMVLAGSVLFVSSFVVLAMLCVKVLEFRQKTNKLNGH